MRILKLLGKIKRQDIKKVNSLIASFEFHIDNHPREYSTELYIIQHTNNKNKDWRGLLLLELIESTDKIFDSMQKFEDFKPIYIDFEYLRSLFITPRFGFTYDLLFLE